MSANATRLAISATLDYALTSPAPVLLQVAVAHEPGQSIQREALAAAELPEPIQIAAHDGVGQRAWLMPNDRLFIHYEAEVTVDRPVVDLAFLSDDPLPSLPAEVVEYLLPSRYCPVDTMHASVVDMFGGMTGGPAVLAVRDWIGGHLSYVPGASHAGTTALDTFHAREGVCRDYAHLLVTLVRGLGIPARLVSAYAPNVTPPDFHALAQVWLSGAWHLVDATGMADPSHTAIIGVGRDAADISFLTIFGTATLNEQAVSVTLL